MSRDAFWVGVIGLVICAIIIVYGISSFSAIDSECGDKGGLLVNTGKGYKCITDNAFLNKGEL